MQVGSIVRMIDDPHKVIGVISNVVDNVSLGILYKVVWLDDLCDPCYCLDDALEVICK